LGGSGLRRTDVIENRLTRECHARRSFPPTTRLECSQQEPNDRHYKHHPPHRHLWQWHGLLLESLIYGSSDAHWASNFQNSTLHKCEETQHAAEMGEEDQPSYCHDCATEPPPERKTTEAVVHAGAMGLVEHHHR
jgi:hypothetical protein